MTVFLNPNCSYGAGRARWEKIEGELRRRLGEFATIEIRSPEEIDIQVHEVLQGGEKALIAAGGDGTVNLLLNAVMTSGHPGDGITLGAVGLGSSNDFHKPFRVEAYIENIPVRIKVQDAFLCDVIRIDYSYVQGREVSRYCLNNASIGITAEANAYFNSRAGFIKAMRNVSVGAAIVASALKTTLSYHGISCELSLENGDNEVLTVTNLGVIKNPHFAGSLCYDTPVKPDDGLLGINLCENLTLMETVRMLIALSKRRFQGRPKTRSWMSARLSVRSERLFALEMDGEVVQTDSADFSIVPKAVRCCR